MDFLMSFLVITPRKPLATLRAPKRLLSGMDSLVILQDILPHEALFANRTFIAGTYWPLPLVRCERFAQVALLGVKSLHVCRKSAFLGKSHPIHRTVLYCATEWAVVMIVMLVTGYRIFETLVEIEAQYLGTAEGVLIIEPG